MSERVTLDELRRLEGAAREEVDRAISLERTLLKASDEASDPAVQKIALAMSQVHGCHKRHWRRVADAYQLAINELENR